MDDMMSSSGHVRKRKPPSERRAEILSAAARIGLGEGLNRITLRAVAEALAVRPGLIHHYFPAVDDLVVEAFATATGTNRLAPASRDDTPLERLSSIIRNLSEPDAQAQFRLWSAARNISMDSAAMAMALEEMEELGRAQMTDLIEEGVRTGEFGEIDATAASVRILMAIDGYGTYANNPLPFGHDAYEHFVSDIAEWALDLAPGTLRGDIDVKGRVEALPPRTE